MDKLTIEPGIGIGTIKFGMDKEEVEECIQEYKRKYNKDNLTTNFFKNSIRVKYDSYEKVNFIEISSNLQDVFECVVINIDVFKTKVVDLVEKIDKISKYDRDDRELGWTYDFPELGLLFWRPNVLTEEDLEKDWFKELDPEIKEDEMRNLFFESVCIRVLGANQI
ncbi:hypothetical protein ABE237_06565 [Brevibacillus formosus]|uniref:hypothetical protein n=1 Tax=Brevibacillus formosus TaxID=54913 RepID=UPI0018CE1B78|nr:hypothetical protein [Brevibacillus formosus]MBG9943820.1 hypothetical protein [Brevibacillus formosus]